MSQYEGADETPAASDWLLEFLVGLVNRLERQSVTMSIPVTLSTGGFLVSGFLIDGKQYFEQFAQILGGGLPEFFDEETKEQIVNNFRDFGNVYGAMEDTPIVEPTEDAPEAGGVLRHFNFVHLTDAIFVHPGGEPLPSDQGVLWRCRLAAVDGFTLGAFMVNPDE